MARIFAGSNAAIKKAARLFENNTYLGIDTETSSLDPHTCKLWSVQFGDDKNQVMIPINGKPEALNLQPVLDLFMNPDINTVFHRASFDLKVLWRNGLDANSIMCTRTLEQLLTAGTFADTSLAGTLRRHLGVEMSKTARKDFYCAEDGKEAGSRGLITMFENRGMEWTEELQDYAMMDVRYLAPLVKRQLQHIASEKMNRLVGKLELPLTYVTALIEFRGVAIDAKKCQVFQKKMQKRADEVKKELVEKLNPLWQSYALPIFNKNFGIYREWAETHRDIVKTTNKSRDADNKRKVSAAALATRAAHTLVKPFPTPPKEPKIINVNSTPQLRAALAQEDVHLKDMRKETLQENTALHPLIELIVEYRKYEKMAKMSEIYEKINSVTGRIHTSLNQNVDTGRYSSSNPNYQNIPARAEESSEFRSCFIASTGCVLVVADYAAIELIIAGVKSKDKSLLYALNNVADLHCYTMSKFLNCDYDILVAVKEGKATQVAGILSARKSFEKKFHLPELNKCDWSMQGMRKWLRLLRDYIKTLTYGIAYGLSAFGLSRRFHCDMDVAQQFIDIFFLVYPSLKAWLDAASDFAQRTRYSVSASGRRRYYRLPRRPGKQDIEEETNRFFKSQDRDMDSVSDDEYREAYQVVRKRLDKEYFSLINRIRRQAANHPIQGTSADITKYAMVLFEVWFRGYAAGREDIDTRRHGIVLTVHDEIVIEVPKKHAKVCQETLAECMRKSAHAFLGNDVNIVVEPKIVNNWRDGK